MKILIPTSTGGHLKQCLILANQLKAYKYDLSFATLRNEVVTQYTKNYRFDFMVGLDSLVLKSFFLTNLINFILLPLQALVILLRENPQAIITCGSDVALPFCYIAKLLGMKVIYIETRARITRPSRAGKLAYKIADLFFVQWSSLKRYYPKSIYAGILT